METTFDNAKILFYSGLRKDDLVKSLGTETEVRNLVETMIDYVDHANHANYELSRQKKKNVVEPLNNIKGILEKIDDPKIKVTLENVSKGFEAIFNKKSKPMVLDFYDAESIAYAVGTYQDKRSLFKRAFTTENPLDVVVREHEDHYIHFKQTGDLKLKYFDKDIIPHIEVAANIAIQMDMRAKSLDEMFKKCCKYLNREGTLLKLSDTRNSIHSYYTDKAWNQLKRGFKGDWSWLVANWEEPKLSKKQTSEIAGYFKRQAEIDGLLFKTLHFACLKLRGDPGPEETTENLYQGFMDSYEKEGYIDASYEKKAN
ncbi:Uncharacterised protein [uncultured archaeon]|nr:Uncharacterised protein [uncultured archaeon]